MTDNLHYVTAWQRNDPKLEADAIAMWTELGVLHPSVRPEQRAKQLVTLAYAGDKLIGITTAEVKLHEPVRQKIAFMRLLIRPEFERQGLAVPITIVMRETLREWSAANPAAQVAGCGSGAGRRVMGRENKYIGASLGGRDGVPCPKTTANDQPMPLHRMSLPVSLRQMPRTASGWPTSPISGRQKVGSMWPQ